MKQNKEDFLTGVGAVDAEHVVLLDLTDQVGALLADENMLFKCADIRQLLKRLEDYTTMHFTHEEQLMEKMGYEMCIRDRSRGTPATNLQAAIKKTCCSPVCSVRCLRSHIAAESP